jgi:hypothetical protein
MGAVFYFCHTAGFFRVPLKKKCLCTSPFCDRHGDSFNIGDLDSKQTLGSCSFRMIENVRTMAHSAQQGIERRVTSHTYSMENVSLHIFLSSYDDNKSIFITI